MKHSSLTSAQPAVSVVEISDPTAAGAGIELIEQDVVQLQPMPLRARRVIVRLGMSAVVFYSTNRRVRTRTSARTGLLAYVTFGPKSNGPIRSGIAFAPEKDSAERVRDRLGESDGDVLARRALGLRDEPSPALGHQPVAAILERDRYRCRLQLPGCTGRAVTADHIVRVRDGGGDEPSNLRAACERCNRRRG